MKYKIRFKYYDGKWYTEIHDYLPGYSLQRAVDRCEISKLHITLID